jgi:hypothetical protein
MMDEPLAFSDRFVVQSDPSIVALPDAVRAGRRKS